MKRIRRLKFEDICRLVMSRGYINQWSALERAVHLPYIVHLNDVWTTYVDQTTDRTTKYYRLYPHMDLMKLLDLIYVKNKLPSNWQGCKNCQCTISMQKERAMDAYNFVKDIEQEHPDIRDYCQSQFEKSRKRLVPTVTW